MSAAGRLSGTEVMAVTGGLLLAGVVLALTGAAVRAAPAERPRKPPGVL